MSRPNPSLPFLLQRAAGPLPWPVRALLAVWAVLFVVMAVGGGLVGGAALLLWSLLRGRRPVISWRRSGRTAASAAWARHAPVDATVVEGQAREVDAPRVERQE